MFIAVTDVLEDIYKFAKICEALEDNEYWKRAKGPDMNIKNYFFSDIESIVFDYTSDKKIYPICKNGYRIDKPNTTPLVILILTKIKENSEIEIEKELNISILEYASNVFEKIEKTACYLLAPERLPY